MVARMGSRAADSASVAFVTASSANHYRELQALVKNLMDVVVPVYGKLALFVYDIGLHSNQSQAVSIILWFSVLFRCIHMHTYAYAINHSYAYAY